MGGCHAQGLLKGGATRAKGGKYPKFGYSAQANSNFARAEFQSGQNPAGRILAGESVEIADLETVVIPELQAALAMSKR